MGGYPRSWVAPSSKHRVYNARRVLMPFVAVSTIGLFFVCAQSSVFAAKHNAQSHREADGGQLSWVGVKGT